MFLNVQFCSNAWCLIGDPFIFAKKGKDWWTVFKKALQGKYIKSLPLHETQQILVDNDAELKIKLKLCVTHDLVMELLSFGDNMKVIEPKSLAKQIKVAHQNAFELYK